MFKPCFWSSRLLLNLLVKYTKVVLYVWFFGFLYVYGCLKEWYNQCFKISFYTFTIQ